MTLDAIIVKTMNSQNMKMHANAIMSFCMYRCIPLLLCLHHLQKTLSRQGFFFIVRLLAFEWPNNHKAKAICSILISGIPIAISHL